MSMAGMLGKSQFDSHARMIRRPQTGSCAVATIFADEFRVQNVEVITELATEENPRAIRLIDKSLRHPINASGLFRLFWQVFLDGAQLGPTLPSLGFRSLPAILAGFPG